MEPRVLQHDVKGDGEPVVLVPGGLTGWLSWIPHQERLADGYRAIRVQPIHNELGSAGQRGDPGYSAEVEREALRLTLDDLGIDWAHFAGWSGGGRALIEFTLEYPKRVRSLALVEPAAYWVFDELGEKDDTVERLNAFLHPLHGREVTEGDLAEFLEYAGFVPDRNEARQHPNWERWVPHRYALSWQGEQMDRSGRSVKDLTRVSHPTVVFKGTVTAEWLKRVADILGERIPNATVVELEGDHACHIQSIDAFLEWFEKHLAAA